MQSWNRRRVLASFSSLAAFGLSGCARPYGSSRSLLSRASGMPPLIDAHCHLFNITDIPASSFVQKVLAELYERPGGPQPREVIIGNALRKIERILSKGVMTAGQEASLGPVQKSLSPAAPALSDEDRREIEKQERQAEAAREELLETAPLPCEPEGGPSPSFKSARTWLQSLRSRRAVMAEKLAADHARSGFASRLLCPALVDYSNWLDQALKSPLPDQIRAGGVLARDTSLPPIHGYVAFDPLRRALVRTGRPVIDGSWDPLSLVRDALVRHGYLGVKVYPPMGFRASGNAASGQAYPPRVEAAFGAASNVGQELDRSLEELWSLCLELDAPIMAHGANSNAAGDNFGRRADPTYWLPVVSKYPALRVMLGHFGRFGTYSAGQPVDPVCKGGVPFDSTWEAVMGRYVQQHPDSRLFADISYLSEIFDKEERRRAVAGMKKYLEMDPGGRHLVFGSDWVMLGIEKEYPKGGGYPARVARFLAECGLRDADISGVMYGNALHFLGLTPGSGARERLLGFYQAHGLPAKRLPS